MDVGAIPTVGFGLADICDVVVSATSTATAWRGQRIEVPIGGEFNVMNSLAAATLCTPGHRRAAPSPKGSRDVAVVPGRFEAVVAGQPFAVIVDYAHTPDGLDKALPRRAPELPVSAEVLVVFGCGGDRDPEKRPFDGSDAARLADHVVITSDNPRSEDPLVIINATVEGVPPDYRGRVVMEPDRRQAIALALRRAQTGRRGAHRRQGPRAHPDDRRPGGRVRRPGGRP